MSTQSSQPVYPPPSDFPETDDEFDDPLFAPVGASTGAVPRNVADENMAPHEDYAVCVRCGSRNLARGYVLDYGDKFEQIRFAPIRITLRWLNSVRALHPWRSLVKLQAEACRDCGAVLLVIDPVELRAAEKGRNES